MLGNGHCSTCPVEKLCGYPYKPCDCCMRRKFQPKKKEVKDEVCDSGKERI